MLDVDDPYVVERVVAAAFGAASARQMPDPSGAFEQALAGWLVELRDRFLDAGMTPTTHALLRDYVRATFEFAGALHPAAVPAGTDPATLTFAAVPLPWQWRTTIRMPRSPQYFRHGLRELRASGRPWKAGGTTTTTMPGFRRPAARSWPVSGTSDGGPRFSATPTGKSPTASAASDAAARSIERYGKKYGWIAYYELVGRLADGGHQPDQWAAEGRRTVTPDIDPTFPDEPPPAPFPLPAWAAGGPADDEDWLRTGAVHVPAELWSPQEIYGVAGGWLLAEGFLEHRRAAARCSGSSAPSC